MLKVAMVGSTGGGSATLSSGELVVQSIQQHLESIYHHQTRQCMVNLSFVSLVCSDVGMDFAQSSTSVSLWTMNHDSPSLTKSHRGTLQEINEHLHNQYDPTLAALIEEGSIDVIISISSDPEGNNAQAFAAAVRGMIPIVGTGGTSISQIATMGGNVIGCSGGSVATTAVTRGICFAASIAAHFKLAYKLPHPPKMAKFQSVVGAALPLSLAVSLFKSSVSLWPRGGIQWIVTRLGIDGRDHSIHTSSSVDLWLNQLNWSVENKVLPVVIAAITCSEVSGLQELALLTGAAAGSLVTKSIVCAYLAGTIAGYLLPLLLILCSRGSILPTASTILALGLSAIVAGTVGSFTHHMILPLATVSTIIHHLPMVFVRWYLMAIPLHTLPPAALNFSMGAVLGGLFSWGSEQGYYHIVALPLIALAMEGGGFSIWGSLDLACLCMPCAGVCGAVYLKQQLRQSKENTRHVSSSSVSVDASPSPDAKAQSSNNNHSSAATSPVRSRSGSKSGGSTGRRKSGIAIDVDWDWDVRTSASGNSLIHSPVPSSPIGNPADTDVRNDTVRTRTSSSPSRSSPSRSPKRSNKSDSNSSSSGNGNDTTLLTLSQKSTPLTSPVRPVTAIVTSLSSSSSSSSSSKLTQQQLDIHMRLGRRGFISNMLLGDFVEACYPFTLKHPPVLLAVRVGAMIAGGLLFMGSSGGKHNIHQQPLSSAYLPVPLSILLVSQADNQTLVLVFSMALLVAFLIPFLAAYCYLEN